MRHIYKLNYRTHNYIINNISCTVEIQLHRENEVQCINSHNNNIITLSNSSLGPMRHFNFNYIIIECLFIP